MPLSNDFLWGGAVAANQFEGGWNEGDTLGSLIPPRSILLSSL